MISGRRAHNGGLRPCLRAFRRVLALIVSVVSSQPQAILQEVFGYTAFRGQQQAIVDHVVAGHDALVLMPTGGGKSLCYQVPAIARHRAGLGVTLVVSPLIALMHDQVGALEEVGVHAAFLNSTLTLEDTQRIERELMSGRLVLLYAAPERVTNLRFQAQLASLHERGLLSLFAIDEAHCVSQWGHDFREDYLQLSVLHERFPDVPRLALTATADDQTRADMIERLDLQSARVFISSFDRPNIRYTLVEKDNPRQQLLRFIRDEHEGDAGIVYCQSRRKVEETAEWLSQQGIPALPYHAGLDAAIRQRNQNRFLREDGLIMVATVAFGMGIDKPDVRFVAHLDLPKNIEGYYQETGRAGRDGLPADAWLTYGRADVVNQRRMIDDSPASEEFKQVLRGKHTDKVAQYGHQTLSTFGIGADLSDNHWRAVLRQLVALGYVVAEGEFNTLALTDSARAVLKGAVQLTLREPADAPKRVRGRAPQSGAKAAMLADLTGDALARFGELKAWRAEVAREHNLPAYLVFNDATLADMARTAPQTLGELAQIRGVGAKKLQAYGDAILLVLGR